MYSASCYAYERERILIKTAAIDLATQKNVPFTSFAHLLNSFQYHAMEGQPKEKSTYDSMQKEVLGHTWEMIYRHLKSNVYNGPRMDLKWWYPGTTTKGPKWNATCRYYNRQALCFRTGNPHRRNQIHTKCDSIIEQLCYAILKTFIPIDRPQFLSKLFRTLLPSSRSEKAQHNSPSPDSQWEGWAVEPYQSL